MTDIAEFAEVGHDWMRVLGADGGTARLATGSLTWISLGACVGEDPELFFPIATQGPR